MLSIILAVPMIDTAYHIDNLEEPECGVDINYQSMTTTFDAHWTTSDTITPFIIAQHVVLMVEESDG